AGVCSDRRVRLWHVESGSLIGAFQGTEMIRSIAYSPGGEYLAIGDWNDNVIVRYLSTGRETSFLHGGGEPGIIYAVAIPLDGQYVAFTGAGSICLWDLSRRQQVYRVDQEAFAIAFSPDCRFLAIGGTDGKVHMRESINGELRSVFA